MLLIKDIAQFFVVVVYPTAQVSLNQDRHVCQ